MPEIYNRPHIVAGNQGWCACAACAIKRDITRVTYLGADLSVFLLVREWHCRIAEEMWKDFRKDVLRRDRSG